MHSTGFRRPASRVALTVIAASATLLICTMWHRIASGATATPPSPTVISDLDAYRGVSTVPALVTVRVADVEQFVVRVTDQEVLDTMIDIWLGHHPPMIVTGDLRTGNRGYNHDALTGSYWSWHVDEDTVTLIENAMEICDGCPSFVDSELYLWLRVVGCYCPWSSEIVAIDADTSILGDINVDGDADADDLTILANSLTGPNRACCGGILGNTCAADTDADTDVDLLDYATLQRATAP